MNKIGFGLLRFPEAKDSYKESPYNMEAVEAAIDRYLQLGGRYFDTCYTYLNGWSEQAVKQCLTKRYPRDAFELAEKLPGYQCKSYEDNWRFFEEECQRCGTNWFDVYMLHWLNGKNYATAEKYREFQFLTELKSQGKAKRIGFSYHDSAALLEEILKAHPEVDLVQLQINYLDWESQGVESRKCYEVCMKHGKTVLVMEPIKGGTLAVLPKEAEKILQDLHPDWSPARWALAFVQSLKGVEICLSGMSNLEQVEENMKEYAELSQKELEALEKVCEIINQKTAVPCTGCRYCVEHCPKEIPIPVYFKMYNEIYRYPEDDWKIRPSYRHLSLSNAKASACIACGRCAAHCPQKIDIPKAMIEAAKALE